MNKTKRVNDAFSQNIFIVVCNSESIKLTYELCRFCHMISEVGKGTVDDGFTTFVILASDAVKNSR